MCSKDIAKLICEFDVISFDIFDTLLLRPFVKPTDVWRDIEERERADGFFEARQKADKKSYRAATQRGGEHTIDEVYALMGDKWKSLKEIELEYERHSLVGNPEIIEIWNHAGELGKKRVIISDMYVDEDWLKRTLRDNGIDGWDGFYLSSKLQKRKATGELYRIVMRDFGANQISGGNEKQVRFLHIGDNQWSDVTKAEENGFVAVKYPRVIDRMIEGFPFLQDFLKNGSSLERSRIVGALAIGWNRYKYEHPNITFWNEIGFMLGGVLGYAYVRWIIMRCKVLGIGHLMFVGRDGYIWQKIAQIICPEIKSDYFYAPRTISVRVLGTTLNSDYADVCKDRQRFADEYCREGDQVRARRCYEAYIRKFDIDPKRTALVDGMSSQFSAQRLVEKVVGSELFAFYLVAFSQTHTGEPYIQSKNAPICFQGLSEFIFGAPEAPIVDMEESGPVFKKDIDPFERIRMSVCKEICKGAVACSQTLHKSDVLIAPQEWLDYYDTYVMNASLSDLSNFEMARISIDVNHVKYSRVMRKGQTFKERWYICGHRIKIFGRHVFHMRIFIDNGVCHRSWWLFGKIPILKRVDCIYSYAKVMRECDGRR